MSSYAFLLKAGFDGVTLDGMIDVSDAVDPKHNEQIKVAKVCDRIDGTNVAVQAYIDKAAKPHMELLRGVTFLQLRARYAMCEGPFLVHCPREFTHEEFQQYLRDNPKEVARIRKDAKL